MIRRAFLALLIASPAGMARAQDMFTLKPIVKAVREGDDEKVRQALLKGENPNQNDTSGQPLLMVAVMTGQITVVETLLKGAPSSTPPTGRATRRCSRRPSAATARWSTYC